MNPIQTGIAVALAVLVVGTIFVFPELSPFNSTGYAPVEDASSLQINPTSMPDNGQLQASDSVVGSGALAAAGDTVTINYVGKLADGTVFDSSASHGQAFTFTLGTGSVIPGFDQGVTGMKEGGKRLIVIPPALGYGAQGAGDVIPPNATISFEVELVKVTKAQ